MRAMRDHARVRVGLATATLAARLATLPAVYSADGNATRCRPAASSAIPIGLTYFGPRSRYKERRSAPRTRT
jgi:hypothetical protein